MYKAESAGFKPTKSYTYAGDKPLKTESEDYQSNGFFLSLEDLFVFYLPFYCFQTTRRTTTPWSPSSTLVRPNPTNDDTDFVWRLIVSKYIELN